MTREFRFGVVATPQGGGAGWRAQVAKVADLGFSSLLMPDGLQLLSPFPSLAMAAAISDLRVGTFVTATPLRPPRSTAWEAHSLSVLTGGRFELGLGTGIPTVKEATQRLGLPYGSGSERLAQVEAVVEALRELDGDDLRTPVLIAAGGPKSRALAGRLADTVTLAVDPLTSIDDIERMADDVRAAAGDRAGELEFAMNLFIVGDEVPPEVARYIGYDVESLAAHDSLALLRGSVAEMADELTRRRERTGISFILVNATFCEQLAPVAAELSGR